MSINTYVHGGECTDMDSIRLDFSVNINPLGCPISVSDIDIKKLIASYPDRECRKLKEKLQKKNDIPIENIIVGNGASEIITLLVRALDIKSALIFEPTFSGYERAMAGNEIDIETAYFEENLDFKFEGEFFSTIYEYCDKQKEKSNNAAIFLCNPNNPTGVCLENSAIREILDKCRKSGCFLIVDESFIDFVDNNRIYSARSFIRKYENLFIISSFTKIYAIPGIRLGAGFGSEKIVRKMELLRPEWSVSGIALEYGLKLLDQDDFISETRIFIKNEREFLRDELSKIAIKVYPSDSNFLLCKAEKINNIWEKLLQKGILVRGCENFTGLDGRYFRIAVKRHEENVVLLENIKSIWR